MKIRIALLTALLCAVAVQPTVAAAPVEQLVLTTYTRISIVGVDGSGLRPLVDDGVYKTSPDWSPDGKRLLYSKWPTCDNCVDTETFVFDLRQGTETRLPLTNAHGFAWSPDGRSIAFVQSVPDDRFGPTGIAFRSAVAVAHADGTDARVLALGDSPTWSPDGSRLAYACEAGICVIGADGAGAIPIPGTEGMWAPDWSPDGATLLVQHSSIPGGVAIVTLDGTRLREFPYLTEARWTPDGTAFAFRRWPTMFSLMVGGVGTFCAPETCEETWGTGWPMPTAQTCAGSPPQRATPRHSSPADLAGPRPGPPEVPFRRDRGVAQR